MLFVNNCIFQYKEKQYHHFSRNKRKQMGKIKAMGKSLLIRLPFLPKRESKGNKPESIKSGYKIGSFLYFPKCFALNLKNALCP